jgi:hypothetical protein
MPSSGREPQVLQFSRAMKDYSPFRGIKPDKLALYQARLLKRRILAGTVKHFV